MRRKTFDGKQGLLQNLFKSRAEAQEPQGAGLLQPEHTKMGGAQRRAGQTQNIISGKRGKLKFKFFLIAPRMTCVGVQGTGEHRRSSKLGLKGLLKSLRSSTEACSCPAIDEKTIIVGLWAQVSSGSSQQLATPCLSSSPVSASFLALSSILKLVKIFLAVEQLMASMRPAWHRKGVTSLMRQFSLVTMVISLSRLPSEMRLLFSSPGQPSRRWRSLSSCPQDEQESESRLFRRHQSFIC